VGKALIQSKKRVDYRPKMFEKRFVCGADHRSKAYDAVRNI